MKKSALAILLAVIMIVSLLTVGALAEGSYSYVIIGGTSFVTSGTQTETVGEGAITWDADNAILTLENVELNNSTEIVFSDTTKTLTINLKGQNEIETSYNAIYTNANLKVIADTDASLTAISTSNNYNALFARGSLSISGGTFALSSGYPAVCAYGNIAIENGAVIVGHTTSDYPVYATGSISLNNADVTLTSDYADAVGLYAGNSNPITIVDSRLDITTDSTSVFTKGNVEITNSDVTINSGANPINAGGRLSISGDGTVVKAEGTYPMSGGTVMISGGSVTVDTTDGTAISGTNGVTISGGSSVNASTTAAMSAIYSSGGDIVFEGVDTKVSASSAQDSAIFTRDGSITLDAGNIDAKSAEGFAPFVARDSGEDGTETSTSNIIIGENFAAGGNIVATTVWKQDDEGNYYSDTILVPADTQLNDEGLLPEDYVPQESEIVVGTPADYSAVDAAIAKAEALLENEYLDTTALEAVIAVVQRDLPASRQDEVDAMAKAIEDAIAELQGYVFVTFSRNNGSNDEIRAVEKGTIIPLPEAPTNSGYIFLGWRSGDTTYKAGDKVYITSDTTFVAVWGNLPDVKPSAPETPETPVFPFYDVNVRDWYYDAVAYVYGKGLMDGVDVGVFAPNDTLTRAMVWTIIARAEGVDTTGGATWYAKAQEWVTAKGISDGENPSAAITRQELVTMLYRLAGEPAVSGTITAPDAASVSTWATDAMTWAMNIGLVEGDENGAVTPTATATRAQAAALIMRYLEA